jgi:hypothetical protein
MHTTTITKEIISDRSLFNDCPEEVKLFIHTDPKEAEKAINQFLKQNKVTVNHIGQSQSEKGGNFVFVVAVFFRRIN